MRLTLLLLLAGCSARPGRPTDAVLALQPDTYKQISPLEYRWDGASPWHEVDNLRTQPPNRGEARTLEVRFTVPPNSCPDPTLYLQGCIYIRHARIGTREVDAPDCFIPVRPDEVGQQATLTFNSSQHMREGPVLLACQNELRHRVAQAEGGALWVSFALLIAAAFLAVLSLRAGSELGAFVSAALWAATSGIALLQQTTTAMLLVPFSPPMFRAMRDFAIFISPGALTAFVAFTIPTRSRALFICSAVMGLGLLTSLGLDGLGLVSLRRCAPAAMPLFMTCIAVTWIHLIRHAKTDAAARRLLAGIVLSTVLIFPDLLWAMGFQLLNTSLAHWGLLPLMGSMALVVQDRFRATALATANRLHHIEQLNEELRFQVESRSRELRTVVGTRPSPRGATDYVAGDLVADRYRIDGPLGKGGMAQVYRATRVSDGQQLALKVLMGNVTRVDATRFAREGEVASRLRHPNLVPVVDVGIVPDGPIYLVLELISGGNLELHRARYGELPWARNVLTDITRGLAAVHAAHIVHRDLKPSNVLMAGDVARLADFGVARPVAEPEAGLDATADRSPQLQLTQTGALVGTPRYMSPEVVRGQGASFASDMYALGLLAFELLTGDYPLTEPPFVAVLAHRPLQRIVAIEKLPSMLRGVLGQLLDEDPLKRPTAPEVLSLLELSRAG